MRCAGLWVAAWVAVALASPAAGATLTYGGAPGSILAYDHAGGAAASGAQAFPSEFLFDPALGTLEAVELGGVGSAGVSVTLDVAPDEYFVVGEVGILLEELGGDFDASSTLFLGFHSETVGASGPHLFSEGNAFALSLTATTDLDFFITGGTLQGTTTGFLSVSGSGGSVYDGIADALGGDTRIDSVTYTYTPIPEPAPGALVALGLATLAARGRAARFLSGPPDAPGATSARRRSG